MIKLHFTPKDEITGQASDDINQLNFRSSNELFAFLCAELHADDDFVYLLAFGDKGDGSVIYVDHVTGNILSMVHFMTEGIIDENVFLFYERTYEDAYRLAIDMKEDTGMSYGWQGKEMPTIKNKGITVSSLVN